MSGGQAGSECGEGSLEEAAADTAPPATCRTPPRPASRSLESLHGFVAAATRSSWLSEKEEEEVGFDWSERNSNMAAKKGLLGERGPLVGGQDPSVGGGPPWVACPGPGGTQWEPGFPVLS